MTETDGTEESCDPDVIGKIDYGGQAGTGK
jgi:hypothetical protein